MTAYYNEIDEYAAQWLRNLIKAGHIAPGDVDTRSIEDVSPDDLKQYTQCHFFAGIGVWSHALRRAGWADDRPVWTGSCPCQPFSVAGKGDGFADERHLWPALFHLIEERRPVAVFGEQVASKDGYAWLDLVQADLEGTGYTVGAVVAPAAGFGAPHQRHRMYWVANAASVALQQRREPGLQRGRSEDAEQTGLGGFAGGMANTGNERCDGQYALLRQEQINLPEATGNGATSGMADTADFGQHGRGSSQTSDGGTARVEPQRLCNAGGLEYPGGTGLPACEHEKLPGEGWGREGRTTVQPGSSFWSAADWIYCRDEKYRPVEPGTFPLAHGATARVGRLRAYGNAICAPQAEEFIKAYLEVRP